MSSNSTIPSRARIMGVAEAAERETENQTLQMRKVGQSLATETGTNLAFFPIAYSLNFQNLDHAAYGALMVYVPLLWDGLRAFLKKSSIKASQGRYQESGQSKEFTKNGLSARATFEIHSNASHDPFYSTQDDIPYTSTLEKKGKRIFHSINDNTAKFVGGTIGGTASCFGWGYGSYLGTLLENKTSTPIRKINEVLIEPFPSIGVLENPAKANNWGMLGSVYKYGTNNLKTIKNIFTRAIGFNNTGKDYPFTRLTDPCCKDNSEVLRTELKTSNFEGVIQVSADLSDLKTSRRSNALNRVLDYCDIPIKAFGIYGATEFSLTVLMNSHSDFNSQNYALATTWALVTIVSFDPLKHLLDGSSKNYYAIDEKTEIINVEDSGIRQLETEYTPN